MDFKYLFFQIIHDGSLVILVKRHYNLKIKLTRICKKSISATDDGMCSVEWAAIDIALANDECKGVAQLIAGD